MLSSAHSELSSTFSGYAYSYTVKGLFSQIKISDNSVSGLLIMLTLIGTNMLVIIHTVEMEP